MRYVFTILIAFFFLGCAQKITYTSSAPYNIVIKNKNLAIADTGFIKKSSTNINMQIYNAGVPIFDLHVENDVCVNSTCFNKETFNKEFFGYTHYLNFVNELFNFRPIYNEQNLIRTQDGFKQRIQSKSYNIKYIVDINGLYFKDYKNKILIKIKKMEK